jgi:DNA-directed RNA polymerase specialized sigma24 family protein
MSTDGDRRAGAARSVMREINERLRRIDARLSAHDELVAERGRLLAARAALTGSAAAGTAPAKRVSQDDVAAYLAEHPGSWPAEIAAALGVPVTNVSQHLYRGKHTRFARGENGWCIRSGRGGGP